MQSLVHGGESQGLLSFSTHLSFPTSGGSFVVRQWHKHSQTPWFLGDNFIPGFSSMASDVILWPFDFLIAWQYFQQYLPLSCSGGVPNEVNKDSPSGNKDRLDKRESGLPLLPFCFETLILRIPPPLSTLSLLASFRSLLSVIMFHTQGFAMIQSHCSPSLEPNSRILAVFTDGRLLNGYAYQGAIRALENKSC